MLAIRMQRTGRTRHAQFRVIVQDSRFSPKSGRVVSYVGSYNPHSKVAILNKEKISAYLDNGAVPSDRMINILEKEGVKLPAWAKKSAPKKGSIKNPEKLRKNRPVEPEKTENQAAPETSVELNSEKAVEEPEAAQSDAQAGSAPEAEETAPPEDPKEPEADQLVEPDGKESA